MRFRKKYILPIGFILLLTGGIYGLNDRLFADNYEFPETAPLTESPQNKVGKDTVSPTFPVAKIVPDEYEDLQQVHPIDLETPEIFNSEFQYNPQTNRYELRSKVGDADLFTPLILTPEEYIKYSLQKSMNDFYRNKYSEELQKKDSTGRKDILSGFDFKFDLGPADKIFGPGGVRLKADGSILTKIGFTRTSTDNPTLTERQKNRTAFDFDAQIQTNINASVGNKLSYDMNYNTESTFDFDTKKIKLAYAGKEDEIVKVLEAGNVSMNTTNSLIRGGAALFGIKTELQFGKLTVGAIFSQQESQSRSASSKGNVQTTPFEVTVDNYDENMHYFLGYYFYDTYDAAMTTFPYIRSGISIDRIEVWVTNRNSNFNEARNIVAFADLGENSHIYNSDFIHPAIGIGAYPQNKANDLYATLNNGVYDGARDISQVNQVLGTTPLEGGTDYEKIESAQKLTASEYTYNPQLGYISLQRPLQPDQVLAVAYAYSLNGSTYQVGEFSTDDPTNTKNNLYVKLLKGTTVSPVSPTWRLMMKNVYTITNGQYLDKDKFRLNIKYLNDTTGVFINYITEGAIANQILLRVMNLDRLDSRNEPHSDGFFDFVEGQTVLSQTGKIIFPEVEPFGSYLQGKINNNDIAEKYVFKELYDSTLTVARQTAEKNKFILEGEYKGGSGSNNINLGGYNIARGSVTVTANGVRLQENRDYIIDYSTGSVSIINPIYENADIQISSENRSTLGMERKTMMGLNLNYAFNSRFNIGATIMNLSEMPTTMKTNPGQEAINNTLFGFNTNYATQSQALTNLFDKLPLLELTAPSQITFSAEYAQLIPSHYKSKYGGDYSYIDDFEKAKQPIDLRSPYSWNLAATPALFTESRFTNDINYGKNRALLAWYYIDGLFTRKSSLTPTHIKNDLEQLSNHYVREILETELFPNKDQRFGESATVPVFNLAFYPLERGPYNLDSDGMNADGRLNQPEKRWGGITKRMESGMTDFEANNIETIEFWLLDPFIYNPNSPGGDLYFNLGEISEDILRDEKKFFENGLPVDGDTTKVEKTVWGLIPKMQSTVYAFDNTEGARKIQDVGLNGLSTEDEFNFPVYANYLQELQNRLPQEAVQTMREDPFSPFNDPSGDNYHYFRGSDYDQMEMPILGRYKRYNGTEGNSVDAANSNENYNTAARLTPDVEDINQDNTLNETEKYFQYKISIRPQDMQVGQNHIVQKMEVKPLLKNGADETVTWYQFKIPVLEFDDTYGGMRDFKTIRFMRMFLTNFSDSVILRFGTFELVRGDWRVYTKDLSDPKIPPQTDASVSMSVVNVEESGDKQPVNYVMPPGVNRILDPGQPQLRQENEQSLAAQITDLSPGDARAIYKSTALDTRQYRRIQMFSHAEELISNSDLHDNDLSIFIRLGSDYKSNYYEYEVPVKLTPAGRYVDTNADRETVWPQSNMFDFRFEVLSNLKLERNREKRKADSDVTYYTPYSSFDPEKPANKITVVGNPTISDIKVIMIGVRNNSRNTHSVEVWFNELRLTEFNEDGGWAGNANLFVGLSDFGTVNLTGRMETAGFGSLDQGIMERNLDDKYQYSVSTQVDLGRFFPKKAKVSIPFYYSYQEEVISPKYNPLDQDVLLKEALNSVETKAEKDSIRNFSQDKVTSKTIDFNNIRMDIRSKTPMPYDPANFGFSYSHSENNAQNATTEYDRTIRSRLNAIYTYSNPLKPWHPFGNSSETSNDKSKTSAATKFFRDIEIGYLPKSISLNSDLSREYYEFQMRDLGDMGENKIPVSFREDFFWNRSLALQWDLTKNLNLTFNSNTNARIESPYVQVNKQLDPSDYKIWKDSVLQSIRDLGRPMEYKQTFSANYTVPFRNIPALNFLSATLSYNSSYMWQRGAAVEAVEGDSIELGNTITNNRTIGINNVTLNLLSLYNKSKFLENVNKKFTPKRTSGASGRQSSRQLAESRNQRLIDEKRKKKFESEITLNPDSATIVHHQLDNKRLRITARNSIGKLYEINYKATDNNSIQIKNKDTVNLKLTISQLPPLEENTLYKIAQVAARGLMMVRTVGFSYSRSNDMMIPYFRPEIGDFLGQGSTPFGKSPGWDFAFGLVGNDYIDKANSRGWLIKSTENVTPAMLNQMESFKFTAQMEPIVGMRVTLNADRSSSRRNQYYFMYENQVPPKITGDFQMTVVSIGSAFESANASNNYRSKAFETFLNNREIIAGRVEQAYTQTTYPDAGFLSGSELVGKPYDPSVGRVDFNSADVLIPSFIAAYAGKSPHSVGLSAFPSLLKLLPNWAVTYDGLMQLPFINKRFRVFTLEHKYSSLYSVGAFNSYMNWITANGNDDIGFVQNIMSDDPFPSSPYDIKTVSINEAFTPLIGLTSTFLNNVSLSFKYNRARNVNLNITSYQITELLKNEFSLGTGYRFDNFNKVLKIKKTGGANFNNELKVDATVSYNKTYSLIRKIEDNFTQAISGDSQTMLKLSSDYSLSKMVTLQAFFDKQISNPLVSSTAYPLTKTSFGVNVRVNFTR
ncbi:MAG: cell surface protein SprA [Candidatus Azobacteroides sp.]|nr:cell surface protein SprA [Candidatus Azobacteroides sp.]